MIPIELITLYGAAAIIASLVLWLDDRRERRYWQEREREHEKKMWAALMRDAEEWKRLNSERN